MVHNADLDSPRDPRPLASLIPQRVRTLPPPPSPPPVLFSQLGSRLNICMINLESNFGHKPSSPDTG